MLFFLIKRAKNQEQTPNPS